MMMKSEQKKIIEFFRAEDGFTILPHINPDGDAFGSGSALFLVLKALRKRVQFVVREQIPFYVSNHAAGAVHYQTGTGKGISEYCLHRHFRPI